MMSISPIAEAP